MIPTIVAVTDLGVSSLPPGLFLLVHAAGLAVAATLVWKAYQAKRVALSWAFGLYGVAEITYMLYHVQPPITSFLLSHTLAEAFDLVAFILVFVGALANPQKKPTPTMSSAREEATNP